MLTRGPNIEIRVPLSASARNLLSSKDVLTFNTVIRALARETAAKEQVPYKLLT